jgi:hypothetical protein
MFKYLIAAFKILVFGVTLQIASSTSLLAQVKAIKVEKTIVKQLEVNEKTNLVIRANKADVNFITTSNETLTITAVLSSKHKDKQIAEEELSMQRMNVSQKGNFISVVNYVQIDDISSKPTSELKVIYTIEIPNKGAFNIKVINDFGKISSSNINAKLDVESKFCVTQIINHTGEIELNDDFGTVLLREVNGELDLKTSRTELTIENHRGDFIIRSNFSKLFLENSTPTVSSSINDKHSEITIFQRCFSCYQYPFALEKSEFSFPEGTNVNYDVQTETKVQGLIHPEKSKPIINITSVSGIVTLK